MPTETLVSIPSGSVISEAQPSTPPAATEAPLTQNAVTIEDKQSASPAPDLDKRIVALTKKEQDLLKRDREYKQQYESFQAQRKEYEEFQATKATLKSDPIKALDMLGVSYDELTDIILSYDQTPDVQKQLEQLKAEIDSKFNQKEEEKRQQADLESKSANDKAIENYLLGAENLVKNSGDTYEMIKHYNAYDTVLEVAHQYYLANPHLPEKERVLSIPQACAKVEEFYLEEAKRLTSVKKLGLSKVEGKPQLQESTANSNGKTLANKTAPVSHGSSTHHLSKREKMELITNKLRQAQNKG